MSEKPEFFSKEEMKRDYWINKRVEVWLECFKSECPRLGVHMAQSSCATAVEAFDTFFNQEQGNEKAK